ncbi:unnamed protein product [Protopolystoma xenopodis]|uniref:Uncharacterized protein n=1 Tax=Protopolystoma xenopodis TaxID=117903 RepID=A0A3S5B4C7_9PLAT|nr:unnamed protein product [Protopolystoma xenopodis]
MLLFVHTIENLVLSGQQSARAVFALVQPECIVSQNWKLVTFSLYTKVFLRSTLKYYMRWLLEDALLLRSLSLVQLQTGIG